MYPWILPRCINWPLLYGSRSMKFEEHPHVVGLCFRTRDIGIFRKVCVATLDCYSSDPHHEIAALGQPMDALGPEVAVLSISGGSTILVEAFCEYLGSGYRQKLIDYPCFDLRWFKRCLQRTASCVFGGLDGLAMTEFIVIWLRGAENRDWMSFRLVLRKALLTNDTGYDSSCRCSTQYHRCVAIDRLLFEGDWAQRWWRQSRGKVFLFQSC